MKKRIYFLISGAIQIVTSIYAIMSASELTKQLLDMAKIYPEGMQERIASLYQNSGNTYIITMASICIFVNLIIIWLAMQDKLLKRKGMVITFSVISLFTSTYQIIELVALINIVVIASAKRIKESDYPEKKKELPILKKEEITKDKIIKAIILLVVYYSQFIWKNILPENEIVYMATSISFYVIMVILSFLFFGELLRDNFKMFKKNFKAYMQNVLPMVGKFYIIYFLVATIVTFLSKNGTSVNQNNLESLPIFISFPLAVLYAPLVEETLFRGCFRRLFKNDKVFIIVSGLVFGLLHTMFTEATLYNVIVMGIPYIMLGGFLAYLYTKTNNMMCNMSFHAFQNLLAMLMILLIK